MFCKMSLKWCLSDICLRLRLSHGFGQEDHRGEVTFSSGPLKGTHCQPGHRGAGLDLLAEACPSGSPTARFPSPRVQSVLWGRKSRCRATLQGGGAVPPPGGGAAA